MITPFYMNLKTKKITYVKNLGWLIRKSSLIKRIEVGRHKADPDEFLVYFYLKGYTYTCTFASKLVLKQLLTGRGGYWKSKRFYSVPIDWFGKRYRIPNIKED
jgi:hypothetical protein